MKNRLSSIATDTESLLAQAVNDIADQLQRQEDVDIEAYVRQYRTVEQPLRKAHAALLNMQHIIGDQPENAEDEIEFHKQQLGDYRIVREIGRGGMGIVYEAVQLSLGRRVALKVLPFASVLDERQLTRFQNEAQAAAGLRHPNIVGVHGVGCERGVHFFAMELVEGRSLAEVIEQLRDPALEGALPKSESAFATNDTEPIAALSTEYSDDRQAFYRSVASLGIQGAEALEYAHQEGIVHRDVKPANLILDRNARIWIADFGLAQARDRQSITLTGDLLGTLCYMSPEQATGRKLLDHRTDVYSLGITLYELLTLQPAFVGRDRQRLLQQVIEEQPTLPRRLSSSVPIDLETIVLKATAKDVESRYDTAQELADDLKRFLESKPVRARRTTRLERARRWAKRNPAMAVLLGSVLSLLLLLSTGSFAVAWRASHDARQRTLALYASDIKLARLAIDQGNRTKAEKLLVKWNGDPGLKDFEWYYLLRQCHGGAASNRLVQVFQLAGVAYSQDGRRLAISDHVTRNIRVVDARSGDEIDRLSASSYAAVLHCEPDTNTLIGADSNGHLTFWDFDSGEVIEQTSLQSATKQQPVIRSVAVSPNEHLVAVGVSDRTGYRSKQAGSVHLWNRSKKSWMKLDGTFIGRPLVAFSKDRGQLITASFSNVVEMWDTRTWSVVDQFQVPFGTMITALQLSPDGTLLAAASAQPRDTQFDVQVNIWEMGTWKLCHTHGSHTDIVNSLCFTSDGTLLASTGYDGAIGILNTTNGDLSFHDSAHIGRANDITFTPDGRYLCSTGGRSAIVWSVDELIRQRNSDVIFRGHRGSVENAVFIDQGSTVCSADETGHIVVWDAFSAQVQYEGTVEFQDANLTHFAVSPDKKWLAVSRKHWPDQQKPQKLEVLSLPNLTSKYSQELPCGPNGLAFSSDSKLIACALADKVILIETHTGNELRTVGPITRWAQTPVFSPDGEMLVCGSLDGTISWYSAKSFELIEKQSIDLTFAKAVAFTPDGRHFATGGGDCRIVLWNAVNRRQLHTVGECDFPITHLNFSPDGRRLLSSTADGKVRIWDPWLKEELLDWQMDGIWVSNGEFSPDGTAVVAGRRDTVFVFHAPRHDPLRRIVVQPLAHLGCDN